MKNKGLWIYLNEDEIKVMVVALEEMQKNIMTKCYEHYSRGDIKGEESLKHLYDYVGALKGKII